MNHWCESCARKNLCYVVDDRPKCFTPITSNDRLAERKTEPQTSGVVWTDTEIPTYKTTSASTEPQTCEECERIIHDAKEEARKEIARLKGADDE